MPLLSIITINYNNATGLAKTIESVVNQTSKDFEYIIIDGGSTDGSIDVIKRNEHAFSYWVSEPDRGIYHAMNKGILKATGDFCQFLNSGDRLCAADVVETMLNDMPDCSIIVGDLLKVLPSGKTFRDKASMSNNQQPTLLTFYRGALNHSSAYIKRSLFLKYGFYDETLRIVSDWKFYLIAVGINNEPVLYRNVNVALFEMTGISSNNKELERHERKEVLKEIVPINILADYDSNWYNIEQINRIKRYKLTYFCLNIVERMLFKYERLKSRFNLT
jgi:glycosyltransferase involved in cell wall biosynthesis